MNFKLDVIGNWNPQLLRELRVTLRRSNLLIAAGIALVSQVVIFIYSQSKIPNVAETVEVFSRYCTSKQPDDMQRLCLRDPMGNLIINWQLWWLDLFTNISLISIFSLLVFGTYLLVNDLFIEQRRGTLNFIRLTPQSTQSILIGKLLGVPSLLYVVVMLCFPLHLWAGLAAKIPLYLIFVFDVILVASCFFFYSAAILFSLVSSSLGNASVWIASGTVFLFLLMTRSSPTATIADWLFLLSPHKILSYLAVATNLNYYPGYSVPAVSAWQWFNLPLGANALSFSSLSLLNYSLWIYWIWQALKRKFPHPSQTLLSKRQSYFLIGCFEIVSIGFALDGRLRDHQGVGLAFKFNILLALNFIVFLCLILAITPSRQIIQEWARCQSIKLSEIRHYSFIKDLIWSEKSPVLLAIFINLVIAFIFLLIWSLINFPKTTQLTALFSLIIMNNFILFCTWLIQWIVLKTQKPTLWIIGTLAAIAFLPTIIFKVVLLDPYKYPLFWLFTPFAWDAIASTERVYVLLIILMQWSIIGLCNWKMIRDISKIGESTSKALFT